MSIGPRRGFSGSILSWTQPPNDNFPRRYSYFWGKVPRNEIMARRNGRKVWEEEEYGNAFLTVKESLNIWRTEAGHPMLMGGTLHLSLLAPSEGKYISGHVLHQRILLWQVLPASLYWYGHQRKLLQRNVIP